MAYPATLDNLDTAMVGATLVTVDDHSQRHRELGSAINAIELWAGTNSGINLFGAYVAGNFPLRVNSSNVPQAIVGGGTFNNGILGTPAITGGTHNNAVYGTATLQAPTINGLGTNSGTIINGVYNSATLGTPQINGGTIGSTSVLNPLQSAFFYQGSSTLTTATIPYLNKVIDTLSEYNGTQFVAAQAGVYEFFTQNSMSGNSSDYNHEIHYNGTVVSTARANPNGFGIPVSWLGSVVAGGTVIAYSNGGTGAIGTASYFWGKRVF